MPWYLPLFNEFFPCSQKSLDEVTAEHEKMLNLVETNRIVDQLPIMQDKLDALAASEVAITEECQQIFQQLKDDDKTDENQLLKLLRTVRRQNLLFVDVQSQFEEEIAELQDEAKEYEKKCRQIMSRIGPVDLADPALCDSLKIKYKTLTKN